METGEVTSTLRRARVGLGCVVRSRVHLLGVGVGVATPYHHVVEQLLGRPTEPDERTTDGLVMVRLGKQRGAQRAFATHGTEELEHEPPVWGLALKAQLRVRRLAHPHNAHGHHSNRNLKAGLVDCLRPH